MQYSQLANVQYYTVPSSTYIYTNREGYRVLLPSPTYTHSHKSSQPEWAGTAFALATGSVDDDEDDDNDGLSVILREFTTPFGSIPFSLLLRVPSWTLLCRSRMACMAPNPPNPPTRRSANCIPCQPCMPWHCSDSIASVADSGHVSSLQCC